MRIEAYGRYPLAGMTPQVKPVQKAPNIAMSRFAGTEGPSRRQFVVGSLLSFFGLSALGDSNKAQAGWFGLFGRPLPPIRRPAPHGLPSGWAPNIRALCSAGQQWTVPVNGVYMPALARELGHCKTTGLQDAHARVEASGYTNAAGTVRYFPTSTPTPPLNAFLKKDNKHEERFALLLGQTMPLDDDMWEEEYEANQLFNRAERVDIDLLQRNLEQHLNVRPTREHPERIRRYMAATPQEMMTGLTWLMQQRDAVHRRDPNKKVGLFVYYGGHGTCNNPTASLEGQSEGTLCGPNMRERDVKNLVNGILGYDPKTRRDPKQRESNVLLMFDMCHSGSMSVRRNTPESQALV